VFYCLLWLRCVCNAICVTGIAFQHQTGSLYNAFQYVGVAVSLHEAAVRFSMCITVKVDYKVDCACFADRQKTALTEERQERQRQSVDRTNKGTLQHKAHRGKSADISNGKDAACASHELQAEC